MIDALSAGPNAVFIVALVLMLVVALIETISLLSGFGFSHLFESWFPPGGVGAVLDSAHAAPLDADLSGVSGFTKVMAWIRVGRVPLLMLLVVFLCAFGVVGIGVQLVCLHYTGAYLPPLLAAPIAAAVGLPVTRVIGRGLPVVLPKDESSAITEGSFIGRSATVVLGVARPGAAAQARLRDEFGQHHYVMVEPDAGCDDFPVGTKVLLVKRQGGSFLCIADTRPDGV
jgi:hypothetical protein